MQPEVFKYKNYLTVDAQLMFDQLVAHGFDPDLALAMIEAQWDENDIYFIPEGDE